MKITKQTSTPPKVAYLCHFFVFSFHNSIFFGIKKWKHGKSIESWFLQLF